VAIHVALYHKTHYTYDKPVGHGPHVVRLRPAPHSKTRILSYSQRITGGEHFINWPQDPFSNWHARLVFPDLMKELCVEVELVAEMAVYNPFDFFLDDSAQIYPFAYEVTRIYESPRVTKPVAVPVHRCPQALAPVSARSNSVISKKSVLNCPRFRRTLIPIAAPCRAKARHGWSALRCASSRVTAACTSARLLAESSVLELALQQSVHRADAAGPTH
jgi:transglutaminase-like putative cysteine protease